MEERACCRRTARCHAWRIGTAGVAECAGHSAGEAGFWCSEYVVEPQRNNVDADPPTRLLPGTTSNFPKWIDAAGQTVAECAAATPSASRRPDPGGANSSPGTVGAGRDPVAKNAVADCMGLWDSGTHMTKTEWAATRRRIQGRLDNLKVDPVLPSTASTKRQRESRRVEQ